MRTDNQTIIQSPSFFKVFRLIFIIFSLYLLGDSFNRWDGFRYHSTFFEFLPSVALIMVLWSIVAVFTALIVWLLLKGVRWFCQQAGWKLNAELLLMFTGIFVLLMIMVWIGKQVFIKGQLPSSLKLIVSLLTTFSAIFLTWRFRNNVDMLNERITPLVWLFGIWVIVSLPIVGYHTWLKQTNNSVENKTSKITPADMDRPNIILVIFDAMTARDMSVYEYHRPTTPFISEWARTASIFNSVKSSSNWTTPSMASFMTGKRVWTHKTFQEYSTPVKSNIENLPLVLRNNGYYNIAFVVNPYASTKKIDIANSFDVVPHFTDLVDSQSLIGWKFGYIDVLLSKLFEGKIKFYTWIMTPDFILGKLIRAVYFKFSTISQTEVPPEIVFNKFLQTLDGGIQRPYFAWIHLYPPHDPYLPPAPYSGIFDASDKLRSYNQQSVDLLQEKISNEKNREVFRARYDEFIRYCDKTFEDFIKELSEKDRLKNTIVIFTSDHGESFEHGDFTHGHDHLYEQVTHIPLIIKEPGQTNGTVINDLVEQIDITPTVLSLANIPAPLWMEGRSLMPLLHGGYLPSKPAFSMNFKKNSGQGQQILSGTVAVWEGDYKLIHYLDEDKSLLFNLREDPDELNNIYDKEINIRKNLLGLIKAKLKEANDQI